MRAPNFSQCVFEASTRKLSYILCPPPPRKNKPPSIDIDDGDVDVSDGVSERVNALMCVRVCVHPRHSNHCTRSLFTQRCSGRRREFTFHSAQHTPRSSVHLLFAYMCVCILSPLHIMLSLASHLYFFVAQHPFGYSRKFNFLQQVSFHLVVVVVVIPIFVFVRSRTHSHSHIHGTSFSHFTCVRYICRPLPSHTSHIHVYRECARVCRAFRMVSGKAQIQCNGRFFRSLNCASH